jgi:hypothetical protein
MADAEKKEGEGGDDESDQDSKDKDRGCCDKFSECLVICFRKTTSCITRTLGGMATGNGYCWFPMKERIAEFCEKSRNRRHPWTDPAYYQI